MERPTLCTWIRGSYAFLATALRKVFKYCVHNKTAQSVCEYDYVAVQTAHTLIMLLAHLAVFHMRA